MQQVEISYLCIQVMSYLSGLMSKPTKWHVRPVGIRPVWSEPSLSAWRKLGSSAIEHTVKTLIRLGGCPGWSESSLGAQTFCWFCHEVAHLWSNNDYYGNKWQKWWGNKKKLLHISCKVVVFMMFDFIFASYYTHSSIYEKESRGIWPSIDRSRRFESFYKDLWTGPGSSVRYASSWFSGGCRFNPLDWQHSFVEIGHEIISTAILSKLLIQVGHLSVTGEWMCTKYWLTAYV